MLPKVLLFELLEICRYFFKAKDEMTEAKQVYEVMNEELNNELPTLYSR
jgi:hypothetical protein